MDIFTQFPAQVLKMMAKSSNDAIPGKNISTTMILSQTLTETCPEEAVETTVESEKVLTGSIMNIDQTMSTMSKISQITTNTCPETFSRNPYTRCND